MLLLTIHIALIFNIIPFRFVRVLLNKILKITLAALIINFILWLHPASAKSATNHSVVTIPPVSVTLPQRKTHTVTQPIIIITRQQIAASGASHIAELLQQQALLQIHDIAGDSSQVLVSMRGFGDNAASNSLILLNGSKLSNPDLAAPDLSLIPIADVERIEIIPGSASILYGDQAIGGIINIITQQPTQFKVKLHTGYGSYRQQLMGTTIGNHLNNGLSYQIHAQHNRTDHYRAHNNQYSGNMLMNTRYDFSTGSVSFNYQSYTDSLLYAGALTAQQVQENPRQAQSNANFNHAKGDIYHLALNHSFNKDWSLQTHVAQHHSTAKGYLFAPFISHRQIISVNPRLIGKITDSILTTGFELRHNTYDFSTASLLVNNTQQEQNLFLQLVAPLSTCLDVTLGLRKAYLTGTTYLVQEKLPINHSAFITEQGFSLKLKQNLHFYLRREGNFRFPKIDENALLPTNIKRLNTQTGVSYEFGSEWQNKEHYLKLALYRLAINNEIAFDPTSLPSQPFGANRNLEPTLRDGLTINHRYQFNQPFALLTQYSYVNARFNSGHYSGKQIPLVAAHHATLGINYVITPTLSLYLEGLYTGKQYPSGDNNNSHLLGSLIVYNANIHYHYKKLTISARLNNLFNKSYNAFVLFNQTSGNSFFYPAPRFNFFLHGAYELG